MHPPVSPAPGLALPSPWGIFEVLLLVTFAAHLLAVNVALGGTLIALLTPGRDRGAALSLGGKLPTTVAIAVNLAIPPLLFASVLYGQYLYSAAVLTAATWLSLFMVVMIAYALLYYAQPRLALAASRPAVLAAACLLLAASLILVNVSTLAVRPAAWMAYFDNPGGTVLNFADATFLPRWLHFVTASLAVAGLFLAVISRKAAAAGDAAGLARKRLGLAWFTRATMVQFLVGLWFLFSLPREVHFAFLGGDGLATAALLVGVLLAGAALVQGVQGRVGPAAWFAVASVAAMVAVRELVRLLTLAPAYSPAALPTLPQYGPFFMFLAAFAGSAAVAVWAVGCFRRRAGRGA
ncbi:hypothetical protein [Solidesulfovibrio sp.]|uniref:hypothetical protein n=1 Tax=Solidesulfovibrio sp. TaxID=2910990 RepID=UPI00261F30F4|nr:hypothetical protein [Solidesulfovibrio sp.]